MFPDFLDFHVDEIHVEMASREFAELELIATIAERRDDNTGGQCTSGDGMAQQWGGGAGHVERLYPGALAGG